MVDTTDTRQRRDFEDQQNELAGRETGRRARFGIGQAREHAAKEKERAERAYRHALDRLLADPGYRRLYEDLGRKLGEAEIEADMAIAMIQKQLRLVEQDINLMEDAAARDPDGRLVFRYADGRVVYADDTEVPAAIAAGIVWPDGAPSAEDYFAAKERRAELQTRLDDWQIYRNDVLGGIRDRYDDPDNPFEDQGALTDALDQIESQVPDAADLDISPNSSATPASQPVLLSMIPGDLKT